MKPPELEDLIIQESGHETYGDYCTDLEKQEREFHKRFDPAIDTLYTKYFNKPSPKAFGSFFAHSYFEGNSAHADEYRYVCRLNGWNHSHFKTYSSMLKWLEQNNAPDHIYVDVYDLAVRHDICTKGENYNSPDDLEKLRDFYNAHYVGGFSTSKFEYVHKSFDPASDF